MRGVNFFVLPQRHCLRRLHASRASRFARCVHIDDALVGRAAEAQRNVVQVVSKGPSTNTSMQSSNDRLNAVKWGRRLKLVERIARKQPNGFVRNLALYALKRISTKPS